MNNPLLQPLQYPEFDQIEPQHALPAVNALVEAFQTHLQRLDTLDSTDWDSVAAPEQILADQLNSAWSPVAHLHSVADSPEWREAYGEAVVKLSEMSTEMGQHQARFEAYRSLSDSAEMRSLDEAQQKIIENTLRDFRLAGIDLPEAEQKRYRQLMKELTELSTLFQQNLQDATDHWKMRIDSQDALAGLPEAELDAAAQRAKAEDHDGYLVNLSFPSYFAVITYADDRSLRETIYTAYMTRASDQGPDAGQWDNGPVIRQTLALRTELAELLGFATYADYSLATKMAPSPEKVEAFLQGLVDKARPRALQDLEQLKAFAVEQGGPEDLQPWDIAYYSEKLRRSRYRVSDEEIRPYFEADACISGLFEVSEALFGIRFKENQQVSGWHPSVRFYEVLDQSGQQLAGFYVDLFARTGKRGGAWMSTCRNLRYDESGSKSQLPIAFLNCNFSAPGESRPSLLSHRELTTLFHEFGHSLHHMLTRIGYADVGGINGVQWDAVELPSQFFENWCWEREALDRFAKHHETGEVLPEDLYQRMLGARHFQSGLFLVRQLEFAMTDLKLHREYQSDKPDSVESIQQAVYDRVSVIKPPAFSRFLCGFGHLFAGGYAAGYYSYLWADQLACDAYDRFRQEGIFNSQTGADFRREILEIGGSRDALDAFVAFRGREPVIGPLLNSYGIDAS